MEFQTAFEVSQEIMNESINASNLYPPFTSPHEGFAILLEEVEELKAEVFRKTRDRVSMKKEAIQVGAMALRFVADLELKDY